MKKESFSKKKVLSNIETYSIYSRTAFESKDLQKEAFDLVVKQSNAAMAVSTNAVIARSLAISSSFKDRDLKKLQHWFHPFKAQWKLRGRAVTLTGRELNKYLPSVRGGFFGVLYITFKSEIKNKTVSLSHFASMGKKAVFFKAKLKPAVHLISDITVSMRCTRRSSTNMKVCVSVACNRTKHSFFVSFKIQTNRKIEKNIKYTLPQNTYECCQTTSCRDEITMKI